MTKQVLTIQEALRAIKLTEKKIASCFENTTFVGVSYADRTIVGNATNIQQYKEQAEANFQSIQDLMKRYHTLKGKVAEKNATTQITVAGRTMSVSSAIEYKTSISQERALLQKVRTEYAKAVREVTMHEATVQREAEQSANALFGNSAEKKSAAEYLEYLEKYRAGRAATVVDPIGAQEFITETTNFIEEFEAEIDNILTLNNVQVTIELD